MSAKRTAHGDSFCIRFRVELLEGAGQVFATEPPERIIDMLPQHTLDLLHRVIFKAFDRFDPHLYEFCFGTDSPHDHGTGIRYTESFDDDLLGEPEENVHDAVKTPLHELSLQPGDVFYYLFDFGDDWWHRLTVVSTSEVREEKEKYPRIVRRIGKSPPQY